MIVAGASAYALQIDWAKFCESPIKSAHTSLSTWRTTPTDCRWRISQLRHSATSWPPPTTNPDASRGGVILCRDNTHVKAQNASIFPSLQGGPLIHVIAAKAVAFKKAVATRVQTIRKTSENQCCRHGGRTGQTRAAHRRLAAPKSHDILVNLQPMLRTTQSRRSRFGQRAHHNQQKRHSGTIRKNRRYFPNIRIGSGRPWPHAVFNRSRRTRIGEQCCRRSV